MKQTVMGLHVHGGDGNEQRVGADRTQVVSAWLSQTLAENNRMERDVHAAYRATQEAAALHGPGPAYEAAYQHMATVLGHLKTRCDLLAKEVAWKEVAR